jgi:hypothetical protein
MHQPKGKKQDAGTRKRPRAFAVATRHCKANLNMACHVLDAFRQDCDLHLRGSRVPWMALEILDCSSDLVLVFFHLAGQHGDGL